MTAVITTQGPERDERSTKTAGKGFKARDDFSARILHTFPSTINDQPSQ